MCAARVQTLKSELRELSCGQTSVNKVTSCLLAVANFARGSNSKVKYAVKLCIVRKAWYFVCTAASAAKLRKKIEREVNPSETEAAAVEVALNASDSSASSKNTAAVSALASKLGQVLHVGLGGLRSRGKRTVKKSRMSDAEALQDMLDFKHVVLDEAGAMLEPDMV